MKVFVNNLQLLYIAPLVFLTGILAECNGGSHLCDRSYSDITYLITHDSYALSPNIAATQELSILKQLDDGVRGIKLSAVVSASDSSVHLCHTFCEVLDSGAATETLNLIASWLNNNPKEVVTIMWNNLYHIEASDIARSYQASSIMPFVYAQKESEPWPTINELIQSGKRVVNFIDSKPNEEEFPWLMYQFSRVFETPYENTDLNSFNCNIDRVVSDLDPKDLMYVMNHFLYGVIDIATFKIQIPVRDQATSINGQLLIDHAINCTDVHQKRPNFIEVDFYTVGEALQLTATLNDAEYFGIKSDKKMEALEHITSIRGSSLTLTEHVEIDNTQSNSSFLIVNMRTIIYSLFPLLAYLVLTTV